eukprot:gene41389-39741_t
MKVKLHPFERQLEYTRAVNAAKLDRMFAKPFVAALEGHLDGDPTSLSLLLSGSHDGEVRLWQLPPQSGRNRGGRRGIVRVGVGVGVLWNVQKRALVDKAVRRGAEIGVQEGGETRPLAEFLGAGSFTATWDLTRQRPISSFSWGMDSVTTCKWNQSEPDLVLCCMSDRAVCLYDSRVEQATQKVVLAMRTNAVSWNPMEPMTFCCANEDHNLYQFDARMLSKAQLVLVSHVAAVLDVDYSPTGKELVSGSFDRTVRLWRTDMCDGQSRDVYHTKRMRRVWGVRWSLDNKFVATGSDDMNVRLWKANAAAPLKQLYLREKKKLEYRLIALGCFAVQRNSNSICGLHYDKLRERFKDFTDVKRIGKQRLVPKHVKVAQRKKRVMAQSRKRKLVNQQGTTRRTLEPPTLKKDVVMGVVD